MVEQGNQNIDEEAQKVVLEDDDVMNDPESESPVDQKPPEPAPKQKSWKKKLLLFLLSMVLLFIGFYLLVGGSSGPSTATIEETNETSLAADTSEIVEAPTEFKDVIYSHATDESLPRTLFTRPITETGDRVKIDDGFGISDFLMLDREGDSYAVGATDGKVYVGTGAETPELVHTATDTLSGLAYDAGSNSLLVLERNQSDPTNTSTTITRVDVGGESSVFFDEVSDPGNVLFLEDWSGDTNKLIGRRSCTQCDGYSPDLVSIDDGGNEQSLFDADDTVFETSSGYEFNQDSSKALFISGTNYSSPNEHGILDGPGSPRGAPYTLHELDISAGTSAEIFTFGEPGDVPNNGFFDPPIIAWADGENGQRRAYSYQSKLFVQNSNAEFDNFFETGQGPLVSIYKIDDNEVLVGSKVSGGEVISYFNIMTQKGAIVMETTFNTSILAVTLI